MALIGIDIGTSFIKGALLDTQACRFTHVIRVPFPEPLASGDTYKCEYGANLILRSVESIIRELAKANPNCDGIVMCTQMASMVLTDAHGNALSNCIGWRDRRAAMPHPGNQRSWHEIVRERIAPYRQELGNELPVGSPACFLFWMRQQNQLSTKAIPLTLADFILFSLCHSRPSVDATNALAYGVFDLCNRQWHQDAISQLEISDIHWPTIASEGDVVGFMKLGKRDIPCFSPVGDYQCALVGTMLTTKELSLNISTGSQVSRITDGLEKGDYQSRPFFENKFANTVSHLPAGRALNVLVDLVTEIERKTRGCVLDPWNYIREAAATAPETDLDVSTTFFPGPCGDKGSITNIREGNLTIGTLFRAALADMTRNYYDCATRIWPDHSWENLVISGGLGRKTPLLQKMIRDRFHSAIRLCPSEEDTLLGLMILGMKFQGSTSSLREAMDLAIDKGVLDVE